MMFAVDVAPGAPLLLAMWIVFLEQTYPDHCYTCNWGGDFAVAVPQVNGPATLARLTIPGRHNSLQNQSMQNFVIPLLRDNHWSLVLMKDFPQLPEEPNPRSIDVLTCVGLGLTRA